jgi:15-cis-phytoene synthase
MDANFEYCRTLVAQNTKERYWASLYAPAEKRDALYALYAFDHEISRVGSAVREPMAGEIRLQWWREVLEGKRAEEAAAHPVAAALLKAIADHQLPMPHLLAAVDAHVSDLYDEPLADFDEYGQATKGGIIVLAAQILGASGDAVEHIARHAGLARLAADTARETEARAHLDAAQALLPQVQREALPALLPAATIRASLARTRPLPLWRRQWLVWRAARNPERIFS